MSLPHIPPHAPVWGRLRSNNDLATTAQRALYRIHCTGDGIESQFRALVVLRIKRRWTLQGVRYRPVCEPRMLNPISLPNGQQAFLDDDSASLFVLGRPRYRGRHVPRLSAPYRHTYVPYDPKSYPDIDRRHLLAALDQLAR